MSHLRNRESLFWNFVFGGNEKPAETSAAHATEMSAAGAAETPSNCTVRMNKEAQYMPSVIPEDQSKNAWIAAAWKQQWDVFAPTRIHHHVLDPGRYV